MLVDERLVDERPEVFGRLQFRGVGWLVDEPDAVSYANAFDRAGDLTALPYDPPTRVRG